MNAQEKAFLLGLEKLTRETGLIISGCGCCGSPRLGQAETNQIHDGAGYGPDYLSDVAWISREDINKWNEYSSTIARPDTETTE